MLKRGDQSAFVPDVPVAETLADALAGRDPGLEKALRMPVGSM